MMCVVGEAFSVIPIAQAFFAQQYASGYCEIGKMDKDYHVLTLMGGLSARYQSSCVFKSQLAW